VRKFTHAIGIAYGLFVWSVAEGFGGPYVLSTTTDLGAAIIYSLVFWAQLLVDAGRMILDRLIAARIPTWRRTSV
jgi:nitrite reductase (NO-forming)